MKIEELEKYISMVRYQGINDEQLRYELRVGGWDPELIDKALKNTTNAPVKTEEIKMRVNDTLEAHEKSGFFLNFIVSFIVLLIVFNLITYAGELSGAPSAEPVTALDVIGGFIFSVIGGLVLGSIFTAMRRIRRSHPIFFTSAGIIFTVLFILVYIITFWGALSGSETAPPVTGVDIIGGFILSVIASVILAAVYMMFRRIVLHFKKK
jgi:hypothetical protein